MKGPRLSRANFIHPSDAEVLASESYFWEALKRRVNEHGEEETKTKWNRGTILDGKKSRNREGKRTADDKKRRNGTNFISLARTEERRDARKEMCLASRPEARR